MENKPYHHLKDGTFRNPEGSPTRDMKFNWSYKVFNKKYKPMKIKKEKEMGFIRKKIKSLFE